MMVSTRPPSDSVRSSSERVNTSNRAAITPSASSISSVISEPVAAEVSSEMTAGDRVSAARGLWVAAATSRMANSAASTVSSSSSMSPSPSRSLSSLMLAMATPEPSASVPTRRPMGTCWAAASISDCVTEPKSSVPSRPASRSVGAAAGLGWASTSTTAGSERAPSTVASICASPAGVSASPRKMTVAVRVSVVPLNSVSMVSVAAATSLSVGRKIVLSACGARRVTPEPSPRVTTASTMMVMRGRAVTTRLAKSAILDIASPCPPGLDPAQEHDGAHAFGTLLS